MKRIPTVRTRFAPSPTGFCHIGGLRSALYSFLYAKKHGGEFLLRIEDTDEKRFVPEAEKYIIDSLNWLGISPDHGPTYGDGRYGPYRQSERDYKPIVNSLIANGHAYYAFDTVEELSVMRKKINASGKPFSYNHVTRQYMHNSLSMSADAVNELLASGANYVVRFKVPKDVDVRFTDIVRGTVAFNTSILDDKVLLKSNGVPTYHLAATSDDYAMGITHVFRGEEWLSSTPLHLLIYDAMEWKVPEFAHLPLLLDSSGAKMSKRNAITKDEPIFPFTVEVKDDDGTLLGVSTGLRERGYDPDALVNYLALLGWNPKDNREIMSREELIEAFDLSGVNSAGAMFDVDKAKHFNKVYLSARGGKALVNALPDNVFGYSEANLEKIAMAGLERTSFAKDIPSIVGYFFTDVEPPVTDMKYAAEFSILLDDIITFIKSRNSEGIAWDPEITDIAIVTMLNERGFNRGAMLNNMRLCFTGGPSGPKLHEMMDMMGEAETLRRMEKAKTLLSSLSIAG